MLMVEERRREKQKQEALKKMKYEFINSTIFIDEIFPNFFLHTFAFIISKILNPLKFNSNFNTNQYTIINSINIEGDHSSLITFYI